MITRVPFTLVFLTTMVAANAFAGTLDGVISESALYNWGISHRSIRQWEIYRLVTGTFLSHDLGMFLRQVVFAATVIGAYEWTEGSRRALIMFVCMDVVGTMIVLYAILPVLVVVHPSIDAGSLEVYDVGMSAGGFGLIGALVAQQRHRWLFLAAVCAAIFVKIWISFDVIADSAHLLCLILGFGIQSALIARARNPDVAPL